MPAAYLMAWEPTRRRWWKQYRNNRYVVSCRQLKAPETKEGSYRAVNAWWLAKRAEVDGHTEPAEHQHILDELALRRDWASNSHAR
jgi:hypothetical protein